MYGLPADFNAQIFVGRILQQIRFGPYSVHFDFNDSLAVDLESAYMLRLDPHSEATTEELPVASSSLMVLAGKTVEAAIAQLPGTLELVFEGGVSLSLLDTSDRYESYLIRSGNNLVVV